MANKKFTDFNAAASLDNSDYLVGYNALGTSELRATFQTLQNSLPSEFKYQGTDLKDLSANWQDTATVVQANSASWATDSTIDTEVRSLTSNLDSVYTSVSNVSANWDSTYSSVANTSASWDSVYSFVANTSATWDDTATIVQTNSASWIVDSTIDTDVRSLTSTWDSSLTTVQTNSATNWDNSLANSYANLNFLPLSGGELTGALSLANAELSAGETLIDSVSSLIITINGSQFKIPLLPV
jgi:hypothetical protein